MALRADDVDLGRDRALVVRFQSGDDAAFDDLYRRYFARVRRFCERRVGDPHEAEELAQEAFVRAFRAMPEFAGERRFYPWMTVIASRLCVDSHRRRQRSTPVAEIDLGSVEADLDELFAEVDRAYLGQALERLAPRHREVLELRERDGWTYQRIADHYDVTLGTVEALLHRARRALRREFEKVTSGDRLGVLAGLPGAAWARAGRRLGNLARRVSQFDPAGAWAQALPVVVAGTIALAPVVASPNAPIGPAPRHAILATERRVTSTTKAKPTPATPNATVVTARPSPAEAHPAANGSASPATAPVAEVQVVPRSEAAERAADLPVHADIGGASVGVDPFQAIADLTGVAPLLAPSDRQPRRTR